MDAIQQLAQHVTELAQMQNAIRDLGERENSE